MKILIIEDDQGIVEAVSLAFQVGWPETKLVSTNRGEEGIQLVESESPDMVILDLGLPDIDGFEVIKHVRLFSEAPILVLTVRLDEAEVVKAFELGANEYVFKPFRQLELLARIKSLVRKQRHPGEEPHLVWGPFCLDFARHKLKYGEKEIDLTYTESSILYELMKNAPDAATHSAIAKAVWGSADSSAVDSIKVHVRHLRKKIEEDPGQPRIILTRVGVGYSMVKTG